MGLDNLIRRMESEEFDLIAVGSAILADPFWVAKIEAGKFEELEDFNPASIAPLV
jgi:2,4-dienoyl-CoA reductase-like NADH-dependent reductase (Old Yellow Enzyme family)